MKLLYIISFLSLYLEIILLKKSEKKQNIILSVVYCSGILYFYDLIIVTILSYLNIKSTLFVLSIFYIVTMSIIYVYFKNKYKKIQFQKYYLEKKQLLCLTVIIVLCLSIGVVRYSYNFKNIKYEVGDSAIHYKMSEEFSNYNKLLNSKDYRASIVDFNHSMFGYYVPCGIFMNLMPCSKITSYNLFNTLILCLIALCFYITLLSIKKVKKHNIFTLLLVCLYTFAYPLNNMIYGFGYLGLGILATNMIILTFRYIENKEKNYLYLLLGIFNFGLFCSYYLFVPVVYLSEFIYLIYLSKNRNYKFNKVFLIILLDLVIPSIFGYEYFIDNSLISLAGSYGIEGKIYQDLIGNYILLIPLVFYYVVAQAKENKCDFDLVFLVCILIYIVASFIFIGNGYVSAYYFYKMYYILWVVVNIFVYKLINFNKYIGILIMQYIVIVLIIFFSLYDVEKVISKKDRWFEYSGIFNKLGNIYVYNKEKILHPTITITHDKVELLKSPIKYRRDCITNVSYVPFVAENFEKWWYYTITDLSPDESYVWESMIRGAGDNKIDDSNYTFFSEYEGIKCILIDNKSMGKLKEHNLDDDYEILYENKSGKLYKKKNVK